MSSVWNNVNTGSPISRNCDVQRKIKAGEEWNIKRLIQLIIVEKRGNMFPRKTSEFG